MNHKRSFPPNCTRIFIPFSLLIITFPETILLQLLLISFVLVSRHMEYKVQLYTYIIYFSLSSFGGKPVMKRKSLFQGDRLVLLADKKKTNFRDDISYKDKKINFKKGLKALFSWVVEL